MEKKNRLFCEFIVPQAHKTKQEKGYRYESLERKIWHAYGTSMTSIQQGNFVPVVQKLSGLQVVNHGIPGGSLTPDGCGKNMGAFVWSKLKDIPLWETE